MVIVENTMTTKKSWEEDPARILRLRFRQSALDLAAETRGDLSFTAYLDQLIRKDAAHEQQQD